MIKVFYHPLQSAKSNSSFSPSAQKPEKVVEYWLKSGHPIQLCGFSPTPADDIALVHSKEYVDGVLACEIENGFGNTSKDVADALPWVVGSMVSAAKHAYLAKVSCFSPTSGAHHARYSSGGGFCTFDHLVLAAVSVHGLGAKNIGLIDLDCHYGDGSADIIKKLNLDYIRHYTFGASPPRAGKSADEWLKQLAGFLEKMKDCELLIFNAGVDPHMNDPLGGILTSEQMYQRDLIVYNFAVKNQIPIVTSLAGGYQRDDNGSIDPVLELHNQTMMAFRKAFGV